MTRKILYFAVLAIGACSPNEPGTSVSETSGQTPGALVGAGRGVVPVTTGVVVRGVNVPGPAGPAGTANGRNCDFSREEVDHQNGRMTGASVQCLAGGTLPQVLAHLPATFNSYCSADASRLKGRLIAAPLNGNPEHCDLSAIKPGDAQSQFGGARWR